MSTRNVFVAAVAASALVAANAPGAAATGTRVTTATVAVFQAAGDVGGGVLEPGTTYPPTTHGFATLKRSDNWIQTNIETSGLPAGAYTVWWVVFDTPAGCDDGCGVDDLFNQDATVSIFWATGGVVRDRAAVSFRDRHRVGDDLGEPGSQHILGNGSLHPTRAEIHNIIKYHGPASDDPAALYQQTHTILGGCSAGANAVDFGEPLGVHCFDPQSVAFKP